PWRPSSLSGHRPPRRRVTSRTVNRRIEATGRDGFVSDCVLRFSVPGSAGSLAASNEIRPAPDSSRGITEPENGNDRRCGAEIARNSLVVCSGTALGRYAVVLRLGHRLASAGIFPELSTHFQDASVDLCHA